MNTATNPMTGEQVTIWRTRTDAYNEYDVAAIAAQVLAYTAPQDERGAQLLDQAGWMIVVHPDEFWTVVEEQAR